MDFSDIDWLSFASVAAGGLAGALAAALLWLLFRAMRLRLPFLLLFVPFVAAGIWFGPDFVDQMGGDAIRAEQIERDFTEEAERHPALARLFRDFPEMADEVKTRAANAYRARGKAAFREEMTRAGGELGALMVSYYLPRAQDADLISAITAIAGVAAQLAERNPELCRAWLGGTKGGQPVDIKRVAEAAGAPLAAAYEHTIGEAIARAARDVPPTDEQAGLALITLVSQDLINQHGVSAVEMFSGLKPVETPDDAAIFCRITAEAYVRLAAYPQAQAANALRVVLKGK